jgi:hypothetical protein
VAIDSREIRPTPASTGTRSAAPQERFAGRASKPLKTIVPSGLASTVRGSSSATFTNHSFVAIRTSNPAAVSSMCSAALIDAGCGLGPIPSRTSKARSSAKSLNFPAFMPWMLMTCVIPRSTISRAIASLRTCSSW